MENNSELRINEFVRKIYELFLGGEKKRSNGNHTIVKLNSENLSKHGDLCFLNNLETWRKVFPDDVQSISRSRSLLEYYLARNEIEFEDEEDGIEKALQSLRQASINWDLRIEKCVLRNERVCVYLNRSRTIADVVSLVVGRDSSFGKFESRNRSFCFSIVKDDESEMTNLRLRLIKGVAENIIQAHGYQISDDLTAEKYYVTTKSKNGSKTPSKILLCAVAKNFNTKTKETTITEIGYRDKKLAELMDTTEHKQSYVYDGQNKEETTVFQHIAEAAIAMEFLAVKPSRALTIGAELGSDKSAVNAKGSSFVLYNTARISAIFQRFDEECLKGNYPSLAEIGDVDFSFLNQEEEWELAYNFLLRYPEMVETCLRLENEDLQIHPQYICSFLSRLCNKFSAYYRRVRILTEGREHLLPTMTARLYLVKAVQIVTRNALRLLSVEPVSRM